MKKFSTGSKAECWNNFDFRKRESMKKIIDDVHLMVKVCDLYYNQNVSQQQIAKSLDLSRPTVSRLLSSAREQGIVQISISNLDEIKYWELERGLEKKYGLKSVLITDISDGEQSLKNSLGCVAGRYLKYMMKDGYVVGISAGPVIAQILSSLSGPLAKNVTFVPMIGGRGDLPVKYQANSLAEEFSQVFKGQFLPFYAPAGVHEKVLRDELLKEENVRKVLRQEERLDMTVVEINALDESDSMMENGWLNENELEILKKRKIVGEICMQFYDSKGKLFSSQKNDYFIGMDIQKIKKTPYVVGIAGGRQKLSAIKGALAGRYINTLITDIECARALLKEW